MLSVSLVCTYYHSELQSCLQSTLYLHAQTPESVLGQVARVHRYVSMDREPSLMLEVPGFDSRVTELPDLAVPTFIVKLWSRSKSRFSEEYLYDEARSLMI